MNENPANDKVTGSTVVTIPEETNNGYYYTTLQATYNRFAAGSSAEMRTMTFKDNELSIPAIMAGYEQNEPIVVHSPVVAPISMMGEERHSLSTRPEQHSLSLIIHITWTSTGIPTSCRKATRTYPDLQSM